MAPLDLFRQHAQAWRSAWFANLSRRLEGYRLIIPTILALLLLLILAQHESIKLVAAGMAIFLFGMYFLEQGFGQIASSQLKNGMRQLTSRTWQTVSLGFMATVVTQSSSLIILLTLSFVSAGLMTLLAGVGILAGANLGTTTGGWLLAAVGLKVDIAGYALPLLVVGMLLISMPRWGGRGIGMAISGVGFLFLGIHYIKESFQLVSELVDLNQLHVAGELGIWLYALIGLVVTLIMQSSHASLLLTLAAMNVGQLNYDNALALVVGINVGSTGPVLIGALRSALDGKRLALLDMSFKSVTAIVFLLGLGTLSNFNDGLANLMGIDATNYPLRVALFHTLFNLVAIAWLLPLSRRAVVWLRRVWPEPPVRDDRVHALYLDAVTAVHPMAAKQALVRELLHLLSELQQVTALAMLGISRHAMLAPVGEGAIELGPAENLASVQELYQSHIKQLYGEIITFAALSKQSMDSSQQEAVDKLLTSARGFTEAVRLQRTMQGNLLAALTSDNPVTTAKYRDLQKRLLIFNREISTLHTLSAPEQALEQLALEEEKVLLANRRDREDVELLIRSQRVDPFLAATLMNDCQTLRRLQRQQIKACRILFGEMDIYTLVPESQRSQLLKDSAGS